MSGVSKLESSDTPIVYLPYHPVFREKNQTPKLRVVFNASYKTSNSTSINDHMVTGPKLQAELSVVLSQWRAYPFVFIADIAKMYRQILVEPRDRDYQPVLWRSKTTDPIVEYRLNTVTYGTHPAPYSAQRVPKQLVGHEGEAYPRASIVLEKDTFVDDLLFGDFDERLASRTRVEVTTLLKKAKLEPRKWASNAPHLISDVDPANHGLAWDPSSPDAHGVKVLSIQWNPTKDIFQFSVKIDVPDTLSKRRVFLILAQLFDPLGWVAPPIIKGKILMQHLWLNDV
ncbi:uncharacterized protein [Neodiprion pinetum]|uniref:uncharacterized protein n=1 Tax=Neodiprion pinetum TaxID=441929 RepID=UPI001EE01ED4|nr:uncharacterized protein LOC124219992 [Neodiprion pinetum]